MITEIWEGYRAMEDERQFLLGLPSRVNPFTLNQNPRAYQEYLDIALRTRGAFRKTGMVLYAVLHFYEAFSNTMTTRIRIIQGAEERIRRSKSS